MAAGREAEGANCMTDTGLEQLVEAATALVGQQRRAVLGIAGAPGAGKSTVATALLSALVDRHGDGWAAHVPMDGFHLADVQLERIGLRDRKGAPDTFDADGYAHLLRRIVEEPDTWIYAPGFERTLEQPLAAAMVVAPDARLVVTEGNYLLLPEPRWEAARAQLSEVWFVEAAEHLRRARLVERHVAFGKEPAAAVRWEAEVDEPNAKLVERSSERADRFVILGLDGWVLASQAPTH